MPDLSLFSEKQRHALQILYQSNTPLSTKQLSERGCSISSINLKALTTEQYGKAVILYGNLINGKYLISPEGRGIYETLQKQQSDEAYQRDHNAQALEIARESNNIALESNSIARSAKNRATWANVFSLAALLVSLAAVIVTIWAELRA
ncbi:MAG: hypothetical protein IIX15_04995 [Clostridia bacterium]|nr:hypothetical protein [Clostridia bacterium]